MHKHLIIAVLLTACGSSKETQAVFTPQTSNVEAVVRALPAVASEKAVAKGLEGKSPEVIKPVVKAVEPIAVAPAVVIAAAPEPVKDDPIQLPAPEAPATEEVEQITPAVTNTKAYSCNSGGVIQDFGDVVVKDGVPSLRIYPRNYPGLESRYMFTGAVLEFPATDSMADGFRWYRGGSVKIEWTGTVVKIRYTAEGKTQVRDGSKDMICRLTGEYYQAS